MVVLILLVAVAFLLVLGVVGKMLELRLKRDGEAVAVRGVVSDALETDPRLFGLAITIVRVRVPLWNGSPVTVRVAGQALVGSAPAGRAPEHQAGREVGSAHRRQDQVADRRQGDQITIRAQNSATGLTGEPVVCWSRRGAIVSKNSQRRLAAHA